MKKTYKRKRKVYRKTYGKGIKVVQSYINKRNRLMLGEGKKKTVKKTKRRIYSTNCNSVSRANSRNYR